MSASRRSLVLHLYRGFLRHARNLKRSRTSLHVHPPDAPRCQWGQAHYIDNTHDMLNNMLSISKSPFRKPPGDAKREIPKHTHNSSQIPLLRELTSFVSGSMLQRLIRLYFEANRELEDRNEITKAVDKAFEGLRLLGLFERVRDGSFSVTTTGPLRVEVHSQFKPELMRDENFAFQYNVRVEHTGMGTAEPVQLVGRHWVFSDADGKTMEVPKHAPGIVGHHPVLEAGQCFEYSSGTTLATHRGKMSGSLKVVPVSDVGEGLDGELDVDEHGYKSTESDASVPDAGGAFEAIVGECALVAPKHRRLASVVASPFSWQHV